MQIEKNENLLRQGMRSVDLGTMARLDSANFCTEETEDTENA